MKLLTKKNGLTPLAVIALALPCIHAEEGEWKRHIIEAADPVRHFAGADGVRVSDANGDGLPDIATGWEEGSSVKLYLHPGAEGVRDPWPSVQVGKIKSVEDAVLADLDGDGMPEIVSAAEGKTRAIHIHWHSGDSSKVLDESNWTTEPFTVAEKEWWMYTLPHDVDRDGDVDLIAGSKNTGASITWFENPGGTETRDLSTWKSRRIVGASWIMSMAILPSENRDFLLYSDRKPSSQGLYLVPLLPESPWFGKPHLIAARDEEVMFLDLAHLDDDERLDIAVAIRPHRVAIFYQPKDPLSTWEDSADLDPPSAEVYGTMKAVRVGLLDGDDLPDFAISCERANGKLEGVFLSNLFSEFKPISGPTGVKFDRIELLDLDLDGDLDVLTTEETVGLGVVWYENPLQ